jgi:hypothetical protein
VSLENATGRSLGAIATTVVDAWKERDRDIQALFSAILRTVFETEAQTRILPLAFDLTEEGQTRMMP